MSWAKERAQKIMGPLKPLIHHGMTPQQYDATWDAIAIALQRVANECIEAVDNKRKDLGKTRDHIDMRLPRSIDRLFEITNRAIGCVDAEDAIRARFPKEEL